MELPWRGAFDWAHMSSFLARRAVTGVESVDERGYTRGLVRVERDAPRRRFVVTGGSDDAAIRVRRLFDLDADVTSIAAHLRRDPMLAPLVERHRGIRVPGGWDSFEILMRAMTGQQISVAAARALLGDLVAACGTGSFPTPDVVATVPLRLGMPRRRLEAIQSAARAVAGGFALRKEATVDETTRRLQELPGVGPWTAHYVAMRALGEGDAFPAGDLVLRRAAGNLSEAALLKRAERWRPWRAYAAVLLWAG